MQSDKPSNGSVEMYLLSKRIGGDICTALRMMSRPPLDMSGLPDIRTTSLKGMFRKQLFQYGRT